MKRFLLFLIFPILLSAQPASRISRQDTLRAYLADTIYVKNRFRVNSIARFDSTVTIKGFQVDSTTLSTKHTTQVLTGTKYWTNQQFFRDSVFISGKLIHGSSNYMASPYNGMISGEYDSIYSTALSAGGQNYIWGRNNTIGRTNPTGTYGNWMWGQYLRSEGAGNWFLGADDDFQKKIVPFQATIGFVNEKVIHWGSNPFASLFSSMLSYATQTPHVKDSIRFGWRLTKYGSAVDTLANGGYALEGQRGWTVNSNGVMSNEGTRIKRYFSINDNDDDAFHFNSLNTSGKPFGNVYIDSAHFIVSQGYILSDSALADAGTWRGPTYHSGLISSAFGNILTGTVTATGAISSTAGISGTTGTFSGTITQNGNSTGNFVVNNSTGTPVSINVYSNTATTGSALQLNRARGTSNSSYSAISSGDVIFGLFGSAAYSSSAFSGNVGAIRLLSAEAFNATHNGAYLDFAVTDTGATTRGVKMILDYKGNLTLNSSRLNGTGSMYAGAYYTGSTLGYITSAFGTKTASGLYVAASSGGAATTQANYVNLTINGTTYKVLIADP